MNPLPRRISSVDRRFDPKLSEQNRSSRVCLASPSPPRPGTPSLPTALGSTNSRTCVRPPQSSHLQSSLPALLSLSTHLSPDSSVRCSLCAQSPRSARWTNPCRTPRRPRMAHRRPQRPPPSRAGRSRRRASISCIVPRCVAPSVISHALWRLDRPSPASRLCAHIPPQPAPAAAPPVLTSSYGQQTNPAPAELEIRRTASSRAFAVRPPRTQPIAVTHCLANDP